MNLAEYLVWAEMSQAEFARRSGISAPTVYSVLQGWDIKHSVAMLIELATKGKVKGRYIGDWETVKKKRALIKR